MRAQALKVTVPHAQPPRGYMAKRARQRRVSVEQMRARVRQPVTAATRALDPLVRARLSWWRRYAGNVSFLLAALATHVLVLGIGLLLGHALPATPETTAEQEMEWVVIDVPPLPPEVLTQPQPLPKAKVRKRRPKKDRPPPLGPIDTPPPIATLEKIQKPQRVVIGLSMESTVVGGSGPTFAVGNSRMGVTERVAAEPKKTQHLARVNRAATRIPLQGVRILRPRLRGRAVEPVYPPLLKSQGIEADVVIVVFIDASGAVSKTTVAKSSHYPQLDAAAVLAAGKRTFFPATRGGIPFATTLKFTVRFRITND